MKDTSSLHLKVQEYIDCFAQSDPLKEMSVIATDPDADAAAVKWLALAALHGINHNARKISVTRNGDGRVQVVAEYRDTELPSPGTVVGERIIDAVRRITHLEEEKGKSILALGVRDSSIDLNVKVERKDGRETVSLKFPD
jgi:hypothetical protein